MTAKTYSRAEVATFDKTEVVFIIDNVVYNVSKFLDEHPGGHEVLVNVAGKDASEDFDDVGHSLDAKELLQKYAVGELVDEDKVEVKKRTVSWNEDNAEPQSGVLSSWQLPVLLGIIATVIYSYLFG